MEPESPEEALGAYVVPATVARQALDTERIAMRLTKFQAQILHECLDDQEDGLSNVLRSLRNDPLPSSIARPDRVRCAAMASQAARIRELDAKLQQVRLLADGLKGTAMTRWGKDWKQT